MTTWRRATWLIGAASVLSLLVGGCGGEVSRRDIELLVSAASSLSAAFAEMEAEFEGANPRVDVLLNLGGSSGLREQILEGAPVDVYASADRSNLDLLVRAGQAMSPRTFARNTLQIAVPSGNPAGVTGLSDFTDADLLIGICASGVPCGDLARQALQNAGVAPSIDTEEPNVRALLTKIEIGELDAGISYVTDVLSAEAVDGIAIPEQDNVVTSYQIAPLTAALHPDTATTFIGFVLSDRGQAILTRLGFATHEQ